MNKIENDILTKLLFNCHCFSYSHK